jgi:hypothetical protein
MADPEAPFYVGYLKLPRALRGFLAWVLAGLLALDIGLAVIAFAGQPPHATGGWSSDEAVYIGQFQAKPYPMVRLFATGKDPARTVLLVGAGKDGPPVGMDALDGAMVEARGYPVRRGDLEVLQIYNPPVRQDASQLDALPQGPAEPVTLTGEIVDSKCYAGAMNPGEMKAHEACGSFCLLGGIPALFVTRGDDGTTRWYVMASPDGGPISDQARRLVGQPVRLSGTIRRGDGLATFTVADDEMAAAN